MGCHPRREQIVRACVSADEFSAAGAVAPAALAWLPDAASRMRPLRLCLRNDAPWLVPRIADGAAFLCHPALSVSDCRRLGVPSLSEVCMERVGRAEEGTADARAGDEMTAVARSEAFVRACVRSMQQRSGAGAEGAEAAEEWPLADKVQSLLRGYVQCRCCRRR